MVFKLEKAGDSIFRKIDSIGFEGRAGGQVVSIRAYNPTISVQFLLKSKIFCKIVAEKNKNKQKRDCFWPILKLIAKAFI